MQYVACRGTLSQPMEAIQTMLRLNQAIASAVLHAMDNGKLERVCTLITRLGVTCRAIWVATAPMNRTMTTTERSH